MTDAKKREKVIRGMECCVRDVRGKAIRSCDDCPYDIDGLEKSCQAGLMTDALALLKKQEARVMTLEEVINAKDKTDVWLDELDCVIVAATISNWISKSDKTYFYGIEHTTTGERDYLHYNYNKKWRCWTSRPTEEQRKAVKWNN